MRAALLVVTALLGAPSLAFAQAPTFPPLASGLPDFATTWSAQIVPNLGATTGKVPDAALVSTHSALISRTPLKRVVCGPQVLYSTGTGTAGSVTFSGQTDQQPCTAKGAISRLWLYFPSTYANNGHEAAETNAILHRASVFYPGLTAPIYFSVNGQTTFATDPLSGTGLDTDQLDVVIPAGTSYTLNVFSGDAQPPASASVATSATGGSLAAATYFVKLTCVKIGSESGPTAEASVIATGSTSTLNVTWAATTMALGCDTVNYYRSTATNTETYVTTIPSGTQLNYVDTGAITPAATRAPPAATNYHYSDYVVTGMSSTNPRCGGGNASDGTGLVVALQKAGPQNCYTAAFSIFGDDTANPSVAFLGDSISAGNGLQPFSEYLNLAPSRANWVAVGLAGFNYTNLSTPGTSIAYITGTGANLGASNRLHLLERASYVVSDIGGNDLVVGALTWQQVALYHIALAGKISANGGKYYLTTQIPRVTTTDNGLAMVNETQFPIETSRVSYNTWIRAGMQMSAGAPVTSGGTPMVGSLGYPAGYFDAAQGLGEVNISNVPTLNGGWYPVFTTPLQTGQVLTGTPTTSTLTVTGTPYTNYALIGQVVLMTSGTQVGKSCVVSNNTTSVITCSATNTTLLPSAPAAGDTFSLYNNCSPEGTHPSLFCANNAHLGGAFATWAAANLIAP